MKIFFLASIAVSEEIRSSYLEIVSILKKEGHLVDYRQSLITPKTLFKGNPKENESRAKNLLRKMLQSDCVVFEGTKPSTGAGYYLSMALQKNIPVLFLTREKYNGLFIASYNRLLKIKKYLPSDKNSLKKVIKEFLSSVKNQELNKRFNLMIAQYMDNFMDEISKRNGVSKADYIRNLILTEMERSNK